MRKHKKGFTIVELVIVIGVIGILSAILIPTFINVTENAKTAALKSDLANAYSMYVADAADGEKEKKEANEDTFYFVDLVKQEDVVLENAKGQYRFLGGEWKEATGTDKLSTRYQIAYTVDTTTKTAKDVEYGGYKIYSRVNPEINA